MTIKELDYSYIHIAKTFSEGFLQIKKPKEKITQNNLFNIICLKNNLHSLNIVFFVDWKSREEENKTKNFSVFSGNLNLKEKKLFLNWMHVIKNHKHETNGCSIYDLKDETDEEYVFKALYL